MQRELIMLVIDLLEIGANFGINISKNKIGYDRRA